MKNAPVAVLYAPGTNCHEETIAALERAGGRAELVLLKELIDGRARLADYQAAIVPGGFSYGDHLGAGRIFGLMLVACLGEELSQFIEARRPILGVCNGFQVLAEAGVLPGGALGRRTLALLENQSARFEDRKVRLLVSGEASLWTEGLAGEVLEMPSAHAEGRAFFPPGQAEPPRVAFRFADAAGKPATGYADNPNGSPQAIAGVMDRSGLVLGLMPHPERASLPAHYSQDGLKIFRNLVRWLRS
jgi:phosphoribosylformylglycinamidine synthase I